MPTAGDERPVLDPQTLRRGDLITVAGGFGEFGIKPRPAILLQSPALFGATVPVPICPITSVEVEAPLLRIPLAGGASGLGKRRTMRALGTVWQRGYNLEQWCG